MESALTANPATEAVTLSPTRRLSRSIRVLNAARAARWDMWEAARVDPDLDVLISPCNTGATRFGLPHVLFIHDTMVIDNPQWFDRGYAYYARLLFSISIGLRPRVISCSRHSASRIEAHWPQAAPVSVLPWPYTSLAQGPRGDQRPPWRVLIVAATHPHKNHAAGIEAVRRARYVSGENIQLTLVGPRGRAEGAVAELMKDADPAGQWLTRREDVSEAELKSLYAAAWLLLAPSLDEGFCLPLLEAAANALPAVHSGRGAMPEVTSVGNARSVDATILAREIVGMLEGPRYQEASRAALTAAARRPFSSFERKLVKVVTESCGAS
jgi:glycosyltransferase involved in cell wall biosynthesis